jgi:hypothetical protein
MQAAITNTKRYKHYHCCGLEFIVRKATPGDLIYKNRWLAISVDGSRQASGFTRKEAIERIRKLIEAGDDHDIMHITDWLESKLLSHLPHQPFRHPTIGETRELLERICRRVLANLKRELAIEASRDKLDKLRRMTTANGCTKEEEMAARAAIEKIMMGQ